MIKKKIISLEKRILYLLMMEQKADSKIANFEKKLEEKNNKIRTLNASLLVGEKTCNNCSIEVEELIEAGRALLAISTYKSAKQKQVVERFYMAVAAMHKRRVPETKGKKNDTGISNKG
jgi:hypothetical protein